MMCYLVLYFEQCVASLVFLELNKSFFLILTVVGLELL
jgi:hypothetical protein